jgi:hypothetical protein
VLLYDERLNLCPFREMASRTGSPSWLAERIEKILQEAEDDSAKANPPSDTVERGIFVA